MAANPTRQNVVAQTKRPALVNRQGRQPVISTIRSGLSGTRQPVVAGIAVRNPLQRQRR